MRAWELAVEQEISPGNYATWIEHTDGWNLWKFETVSGIYLGINKPIRGNAAPAPIGIQQAFFGPTPYASIIVTRRPYVSFRGKHVHSSAQFRVVGDRFLSDDGVSCDPREFDGKLLEVVVKSMPTERSYNKAVEERGVIDMTGAAAILDAATKIDRVSS